MILGNLIISVHYPRGTLCAGVGLVVTAAYYVRGWCKLRTRFLASSTIDPQDPSTKQPLPEVGYLHLGIASSLLVFMSAAVADAQNDWLYQLTSCLMGLCFAMFVAMFGVGFVSLVNLWKETVRQLKNAEISRLFLSLPVAVLWLEAGLTGLVLMGMFVERASKYQGWVYWGHLFRDPAFGLIAIVFYLLWKAQSSAALVLRLILLVLFSALMVAAVAFGFWWIASESALSLGVLLAAVGSLNVIFYSRWVRQAVLEDNL